MHDLLIDLYYGFDKLYEISRPNLDEGVQADYTQAYDDPFG